MRSIPALAVVVCAGVAAAQVEVPSARAPDHGGGAVQRRALSVPAGEAWGSVSVRGSSRQGPLVVPDSDPGGALQVGVNGVPPGGPISAKSAGLMSVEGLESVWRVRVDAPGVDGVRLCLANVDLAPGESIVVAGGDGDGYVVLGRGANGDGREWTPVLEGEHGYLEWRGGAGSVPRFVIEQVAEIDWPEREVTDLFPCHVDVRCETVDPIARDSVGRIVYSTPQGTFVCSGALLNDADAGTTLGWLLTSESCISTSAAAESVTVYWFYQTPACSGTPPSLSSLPVSQGAALIAAAPASDAALLKLSQDPANGQGLAAWTGAEPSGEVTTIHHPEGEHKRIARGAATLATPICFGELPYYQYHYIDYSLGITEAGSIGAPLFDSAWRVVGQLSGVCAFSPPTCQNGSVWNAVFGRFSRTLPFVCGPLTGQSSLARVYVDASANGTGTGESWANAYTSLGTALNAACPPAGGMDVWVADGVYKPNGVGRNSSFVLVDGVALYGGFAGGESQLSQRPGTSVTVLSGDLDDNDQPGFLNRADNSFHVVRATGVDGSAILDGFTIRGGAADGPNSFNDKGGGLYVEAASPRVRGCVFEDNSASFAGAGVACFEDGVVDIAGCAFAGNRADFGAGISLAGGSGIIASSEFDGNIAANDGGGIDLYESSVTVDGCTFRNNTASDGGGGFSAFASTSVAVQDCHFENNGAAVGAAVQSVGSTVALAGCVLVDNHSVTHAGGFIAKGGSHATVTACRFLGNSAGSKGGGMYTFGSTATVSNCEFSGNSGAPGGGGGLWTNSGSQTTLANCTFSKNTAATIGGGVVIETGSGTLVNCILWGNADGNGGGEAGQIRFISGATRNISYSALEGWTGSLGGTGNIGGDPLLVSALGIDGTAGTMDDDLSLGGGSPARDAGSNTGAQGLSTDLRGGPRRADDTCVPDTGEGTAPIVDMGAVEGGACVATCYANCDASTVPPVLNANDFVCFLTQYAAGNPYANCDESTVPPVLNANDFVCFLVRFAGGCS